MSIILFIQLIVSACLTGLVLLVQLTHYPSFHYVSEKEWRAFHEHHSKSISYIVIPLMLIELGLSLYTVWLTPKIYFWIALGFVAIIWLNTFLQAVPLHGRLSAKKDEKLISRLVRVNIIRTIFWVLRTGFLAWIVWEGIGL